MKLLLDEQLPRQFADHFPGQFDVQTVQSMGWGSTKNGALLQLAANNQFSALITGDKNIEYQQNHLALPVPVIVLMSVGHRLQDITPLIPGVVETLNGISQPGVYRVPD